MDYQELIKRLRMKATAYNPETHVLVPREPSEEMLCKATKVDLGKDCDEKGICISLYQAMIAAAPQPEPVESEPVAYRYCYQGHEIGYSDKPQDEDIPVTYYWQEPLYTTPQPDRTAELEAALKVARETLIDLAEGTRHPARHNKALDKINEVLKP